MTYDQAMRILQYEVYRGLGLDFLNPALSQQIFGNLDLLGAPYNPPFRITLNAFSESVDVNGNALAAQFIGDIITLDPTVFFEFGGDYEIIERYTNPIQQEIEDFTSGNFVASTSRSGQLTSGTDQNSGMLQFVLRTFNRSAGIFTDVSVAPNASFQTVPGQLPFAGTSASVVGFRILSGTLTVTTAGLGGENNIEEVAWSAISLQIANGVIVNYPSNYIEPTLAPGSAWFYINDPTQSGSDDCIVVSQTEPTPGPGIYGITSLPSTSHATTYEKAVFGPR